MYEFPARNALLIYLHQNVCLPAFTLALIPYETNFLSDTSDLLVLLLLESCFI